MRLPMRLLVTSIFVLAVADAFLGHRSQGGTSAPWSVSELAGVPDGSVTPGIWALALLGQFGDPASAQNLRAITGWERAEGGHWANAASHNPLNTTRPEPGSRSINAAGVQAYASWGQGLAATVATLRNGLYESVLAVLRRGDCAPCVAEAVAASPWGTGWFPT